MDFLVGTFVYLIGLGVFLAIVSAVGMIFIEMIKALLK